VSDSPAEFRRKTEEMFRRANEYLDAVSREFILGMAAVMIENTPGPNKQLEETGYIATGRLHSSYTWGPVAFNESSRWEGGPYSDYGEPAMAAIETALNEAEVIPAMSYIQSDVAYAWIVHQGLGRMPIARPWVTEKVIPMQESVAAEARAKAMGRG
jgi:hypothetical protein